MPESETSSPMQQWVRDVRVKLQAADAALASVSNAFQSMPPLRCAEDAATLLYFRRVALGLDGPIRDDEERKSALRQLVQPLDSGYQGVSGVASQWLRNWEAFAGNCRRTDVGVFSSAALREAGAILFTEADPETRLMRWGASGLPSGHPLGQLAHELGYFSGGGPAVVCGSAVHAPGHGFSPWAAGPWTSLVLARRLTLAAVEQERRQASSRRYLEEEQLRLARVAEENRKLLQGPSVHELAARVRQLEQATAGKPANAP